MSVTQTIPRTALTVGARTFAFTDTQQPWINAVITIDRTVAGGLNSLTPADTLAIDIQYSLDAGATWGDCGTDVLTGGSEVVKGVTVPTSNTIGVGIGHPFPTGTKFRVVLTASTAVVIQGTVVYESFGLN